MDFATLIGFIAGVSLFAWSLVAGSGGNVAGFWDSPSFVLVIGGGVATTLLSIRLKRFLAFITIIKNAFISNRKSPEENIQLFTSLAETARREGILALQNQLEKIKDPFVSNALQMVVDGTEPAIVNQTMEYEIGAIDARHGEGKQVLDLLGKYSPAYGMIGTLVGLVVMLQNMDDPKKIGPGMAVALLTTLYGAVMANMVCLPLADKLNNHNAQEMMALSIAQAAVQGIQAGDNPRVLQQKLAGFLPSSARIALLKAPRAA